MPVISVSPSMDGSFTRLFNASTGYGGHGYGENVFGAA